MKGQAAYAREVLDTIPGRAAMAKRVANCRVTSRSQLTIQFGGPYALSKSARAGANNFQLFVREGATEQSGLLIDPEIAHAGRRPLRR